jgi:hypothetical protein
MTDDELEQALPVDPVLEQLWHKLRGRAPGGMDPDTQEYQRLLSERADKKRQLLRQMSDATQALSPVTQSVRVQEDAASGPEGWNRQWTPFFESMPFNARMIGKRSGGFSLDQKPLVDQILGAPIEPAKQQRQALAEKRTEPQRDILKRYEQALAGLYDPTGEKKKKQGK